MLKKRKIAFVYDWFDKWGGAERIILTLYKFFPDASIYSSYFDEKKAFWAKNIKIKTSFLQKFPNFIKKSRIFSFPFYPLSFESFIFDDYDLVISLTSSFAKAIITKPKTKHICYLLTPTRFLWSHEKEYFKSYSFLFKNYLNYLKFWDKIIANRPDKIISISQIVKKRCLKYYGLDSQILYPPFDIDYWKNIKNKITDVKYLSQKLDFLKKTNLFKFPYYLIVSRLEPYKKIDLVINLFNKLNYYLVIVGEGSEKNKLKKIANKNVLFFSNLTDEELGLLYSRAEALIMPQEEDFGYTALEGQFFNCPIISYKKSGVAEIVKDGETGIFFQSQTETSLKEAIERFIKIKYNLKIITKKVGEKNINKFGESKWFFNFSRIINNL